MFHPTSTVSTLRFIRHHHPVPCIDPQQYRLCVDGVGTKSVTLCLEDIKSRFLKREAPGFAVESWWILAVLAQKIHGILGKNMENALKTGDLWEHHQNKY